MSRAPLVWVTRTAPGALATARGVRALGLRALAAPLLAVRPLPVDLVDLGDVAALAFTSAEGVRAFAGLSPRRDRPVFAVGDATAAAARAAGFAEVRSADGAGRDLAALIGGASPGGAVLAPGARQPAFDLRAALVPLGVEVRPLAVYATEPVHPPPARALRLFAGGRFRAVLLHSPAAGRALASILAGAGHDPRPASPPPWLLGLSPACLPADPLAGWPSRAAPAPRERDLLALLAHLDTPTPLR